MAFLAGPSAPVQSALVSLANQSLWTGFGYSPRNLSPIETAILQLVGTMNRLTGLLEVVLRQPPPEDDFMKGWGEPGGDIES